MLHFRAETLELIAKGETLSVVGDYICRGIERSFPGVVCTLLTVDRAGLLHPLSAPSLPEEITRTVDNVSAGPNVGSCGTAAYTGYPVEVHDIACDPRWHDFKEGPLSQGLRACWSSPLKGVSGHVIATFAVYFRERRGPTASEREAIQLCLHLCDLALARHSRVEDQERRANIDALTSLPNRGSFERAIDHLSCSQPETWALLVIDLDNLKPTNDTFGHSAGDRLIQEVAARLSRIALPDRVFRIGGDEFAVLIMATDRLKDIKGTAAAILAELGQAIEFPSFSIVPAATIGGAIVSGDEPDALTVYRNADIALYQAKDTCAGGFVQFEPNMAARVNARLLSIGNLERALTDHKVDAWYQPVVDMRSQRIVGLEALCRIKGSCIESAPEALLQSCTTDAAIAAELTQQMLLQVAEDMRCWHAVGVPLCPVSVNIAAADLWGGKLYSVLDDIFPPATGWLNLLVLEVTEAAGIGRRAHSMRDLLISFRQKGISVALDDFGTGYASLTQLLNLPVDIIKIDHSLVARLTQNRVATSIVSAVIAVAADLGAQVVAKGVETVEQADKLKALGCNRSQGFLYSPAVPRSEATVLLMRHSEHSPGSIPLLRNSAVAPQVIVSGNYKRETRRTRM